MTTPTETARFDTTAKVYGGPRTAYKLVRKRKDGSFGPLFINRRMRIPVGQWLEAEYHPTKGYAPRPFWHCTGLPEAGHLTMRGRVWVEVRICDYHYFNRPSKQGGVWLLADRMKVVKEFCHEA